MLDLVSSLWDAYVQDACAVLWRWDRCKQFGAFFAIFVVVVVVVDHTHSGAEARLNHSRDSTAIFSATVTNIFAHGGPQIRFLFSNSVIVSLKEVFWHSSLLPHHCCFFFLFFFRLL